MEWMSNILFGGKLFQREYINCLLELNEGCVFYRFVCHVVVDSDWEQPKAVPSLVYLSNRYTNNNKIEKKNSINIVWFITFELYLQVFQDVIYFFIKSLHFGKLLDFCEDLRLFYFP